VPRLQKIKHINLYFSALKLANESNKEMKLNENDKDNFTNLENRFV